MSTPDQDVAANILDGLRADRLLSDETIARIKVRLADGTMTAEDWTREVGRDLAERASDAY
ncbi:MAG: hypothetical protein ACKVVP_11655 [Chloroflexota bacterium]